MARAKMPFFPFYPLDWLRDTAKVSLTTQAQWMKILCYAWNEEERGVYEREEIQICRELGVAESEVKNLIDELYQVATVSCSVRNNKTIVRIESRRMVRDEKKRQLNAIYQDDFRNKLKVRGEISHRKIEVRAEKLEVRSQKLEDREKTETTSPPKPPKGASYVLGWFSVIWKEYPAHRRHGRPAALKRFAKSVKTLDDAKRCGRALSSYLKSVSEEKYVMRASKWFDEWEDHADDTGRDSTSVHDQGDDGKADRMDEGEGEQSEIADNEIRKLADSKRFPA